MTPVRLRSPPACNGNSNIPLPRYTSSLRLGPSPFQQQRDESPVAESVWKTRYEEAEKRRKQALSDSQRCSRDLGNLENRYQQLQGNLNILEKQLTEKDDKYIKLCKVSEQVYNEYEKLKSKYEMETGVMQDAMKTASQAVIGHLQGKVSNMIVPAILEHEAISGLSVPKPSGMTGRSSSALNALLQELSNVHKIIGYHGVDPEIITQIFRQIFYFICAISLNNLLLRRDLCHWSKGVQIRYNLSHLEQWCREHRLQDTSVLDTLQPLIQAAQLLQARKMDEDVQSICDMCDKLSMFQIIKILSLYTPADEFEERVPANFTRRIKQKLKERNECQDQLLLMDMEFSFSVRVPFNPSNIRLEDIEIPEVLNLPMLNKA